MISTKLDTLLLCFDKIMASKVTTLRTYETAMVLLLKFPCSSLFQNWLPICALLSRTKESAKSMSKYTHVSYIFEGPIEMKTTVNMAFKWVDGLRYITFLLVQTDFNFLIPSFFFSLVLLSFSHLFLLCT